MHSKSMSFERGSKPSTGLAVDDCGKPIIGYETALEYWRLMGPGHLSERKSVTQLRGQNRAVLDPKSLRLLQDGAIRLAGLSVPLHVLSAGSTVIRQKNLVSHSQTTVPAKSLVVVKDEYLVSSPEFCFLQMARKLPVTSLIQLGFELCGTYSLLPGEEAVNRINPLTSASALRAFAAESKGQKGRREAQRAAQYVIDGSASPMETVLAMFLCLPRSLGGYGFERPLLNSEIVFPASIKRFAGRERCICDLYWPDVRLCVEYDSNAYHTGAERIASDSKRRNALLDYGVEVITVTTKQLFDVREFDKVAHQIGHKLGKRIHASGHDFDQAHARLRESAFDFLGYNDEDEWPY